MQLGLVNLVVLCPIWLVGLSSLAEALNPTSNDLLHAGASFDDLTSQWTSSWGLNSNFIEVAGVGQSLDDVLRSCSTSAPVVALLRGPKPTRRNVTTSEPFIQILDEQNSVFATLNASHKSEPLGQPNQGQQLLLSNVLGLPALNEGMKSIEKVLGRPMFPFRIQSALFNGNRSTCKSPLAVWDVSSGTIFVDQTLRESMGGYVERISRISSSFASSLTSRLAAIIPTRLSTSSQGAIWSQLTTTVVPGALLVAFGSQIPLWFCIACPVVLGLLAPFIINAGFGEAAEAICSHYNLPVDECNDLWYGAFAAAMILSLASAIPIVFICQIPKCARMTAS